jgi:hypothetical protein
VHEVVEALIISTHHVFDHFVDFGDAVVDDLYAVVQVGELVLLGTDAGSEDIVEHLRHGLLAGGLWVGLLFVDLLGGLVGLVLVGGVAVLVRLFARVGVCSGDDEFVDFERVGVFGGAGADAEVVAFREADLGGN